MTRMGCLHKQEEEEEEERMKEWKNDKQKMPQRLTLVVDSPSLLRHNELDSLDSASMNQ